MKVNIDKFEITQILSLEQQIIPNLYMGRVIPRHESITLLSSKKIGKRKQVNGLVYSSAQMPSKKKKKGWQHVIRAPQSKNKLRTSSAFEIMTPDKSIIYIH